MVCYALLHYLGCRFPVNSADFWLCLRKFCGEADRRRLAGQRREFKIHRKSTAQLMILFLAAIYWQAFKEDPFKLGCGFPMRFEFPPLPGKPSSVCLATEFA